MLFIIGLLTVKKIKLSVLIVFNHYIIIIMIIENNEIKIII